MSDLYREKSLDRIASPEQMDACIKVAGPSLWMPIAIVILLTLGALIWGIFGTVETRVYTEADSDGSVITCIISATDAESVEKGQVVRVENSEFSVEGIKKIDSGNFEVTVSGVLSEGTYDAVIVTDRIQPITFLLN